MQLSSLYLLNWFDWCCWTEALSPWEQYRIDCIFEMHLQFQFLQYTLLFSKCIYCYLCNAIVFLVLLMYVLFFLEFFEEMLTLVYNLTEPQITPNMWGVLPLLYEVFQRDNVEYFVGELVCCFACYTVQIFNLMFCILDMLSYLVCTSFDMFF